MASGFVTTMIRRSPEDVFAVLADVRLNAEWASASVEAEKITPGPVGLGTVAREVSQFMGRRMEVRSEVIEFEPDRKLGYLTSGGPFPFRGSFATEPIDGGTRLTATFEAQPDGLFRFADRLFGMLAMRQFVRDLGTLKRLMESNQL